VTPQGSRTARSWLNWSQTELAKRAKVSLSTIRDYETGKREPIPNNVEAMERAIREAGIEFLYDVEGNPAGILVRGARLDLSAIDEWRRRQPDLPSK
jgi:ribosome-binding protein aMBF1 (putative translation factor)